MSDLVQIRRVCKIARRGLSAKEQRAHALSVARLVDTITWVRNSQRIAVYSAVRGELDLTPCCARLHKAGKQLYLPVLRPRPQRKLWFALHVPGKAVRNNRLGIPEPVAVKNTRQPALMLDVLLLPLVAFDAECRRLGMGGGFYDRTLAYQRRCSFWQRPRLIGVAHECQHIATLPARPWDVLMDAIVTEQRIYMRR